MTKKELKSLKKRRELEKRLVIEAEKAGHSLSNQSNIWYIVSNKWLYKWKCFIQNEVTLNNFFDNEEWAASIDVSQNENIGVLPPGQITNREDLLIDEDRSDFVLINNKDGLYGKDLKVKPGMQININYRAVKPFVWYLFYINYGGNACVPQLPRESIDIYSKDLTLIVKSYLGFGRILQRATMHSLLTLG